MKYLVDMYYRAARFADDIADSFDYKNKYAIIEYLNGLAQRPGIDLLVLTHNFDFYRTVANRSKEMILPIPCGIKSAR